MSPFWGCIFLRSYFPTGHCWATPADPRPGGSSSFIEEWPREAAALTAGAIDPIGHTQDTALGPLHCLLRRLMLKNLFLNLWHFLPCFVFEGREKNCKKHITTCDMRCNSDPWLHSKLKRNHNLRFSFIFLYHFQNCNIAINFEYCVKSIVKPLAKESLLNVLFCWLCYDIRYISMQNSLNSFSTAYTFWTQNTQSKRDYTDRYITWQINSMK